MITHEEAIELLQRAVTEKGDGHTVAKCAYQNEGQPVCIVGYVLSYVNLLDQMEGNPIFRQWVLAEDHFTPAAIEALTRAQIVQDIGTDGLHGTSSLDRSWGAALIAAKEVAP